MHRPATIGVTRRNLQNTARPWYVQPVGAAPWPQGTATCLIRRKAVPHWRRESSIRPPLSALTAPVIRGQAHSSHAPASPTPVPSLLVASCLPFDAHTLVHLYSLRRPTCHRRSFECPMTFPSIQPCSSSADPRSSSAWQLIDHHPLPPPSLPCAHCTCAHLHETSLADLPSGWPDLHANPTSCRVESATKTNPASSQ